MLFFPEGKTSLFEKRDLNNQFFHQQIPQVFQQKSPDAKDLLASSASFR